MEIPVSIDFSKIYAEKVLYSETIQYKILKGMEEDEWKAYKTSMLRESVDVSYDAVTDAFVAKPKQKLTLTESRDRIKEVLSESEAKYSVKPNDDKFDVEDSAGKKLHTAKTDKDARAWIKLQDDGKKTLKDEEEIGNEKDIHRHLTEAVGKKELLLDEEDEEDFDSSVNGLLNFSEDDEEEVQEANEPDATASAGANMEVLVGKLEALINQVLDSRESSAKGQFEEIPAGEASDIGDFSPEADLPTPGVEDNKTDVDELLTSEFPQVQNKIDVIKDRIETEVSYADYLNGETDVPYDTSAPEVYSPVADDVDFDEPEEIDMMNQRSDDFSDEGEEVLLDDDFERNAELTSGGSIYEDESDAEIENAVDAEVDAVEGSTPPVGIDTTINVGGMPIHIMLTGMMITKGDVAGIAEAAKKKGVSVKKIMNETQEGKDGYKAFYNGKTADVYANSAYEAKQKAIEKFKPKKSQEHMVHVKVAEVDGKQVTHTMSESLNKAPQLSIIVEYNSKKYKIDYTDVSKYRNKMPFSIKHEKFQSLSEALERITSINMKSIKEKENFKKFVTEDIVSKEAKSVEGSDIFEGYQNVKDIGGWNVKALGNVSLKTGINEVLSNITTNQKDKNTLVKTNEGQYFLIKGSLNEKSKDGVSKQLVDMDRKCEYGTATVIGTFQNSLKGLGQIMEQIKRTNIPLLIWK